MSDRILDLDAIELELENIGSKDVLDLDIVASELEGIGSKDVLDLDIVTSELECIGSEYVPCSDNMETSFTDSKHIKISDLKLDLEMNRFINEFKSYESKGDFINIVPFDSLAAKHILNNIIQPYDVDLKDVRFHTDLHKINSNTRSLKIVNSKRPLLAGIFNTLRCEYPNLVRLYISDEFQLSYDDLKSLSEFRHLRELILIKNLPYSEIRKHSDIPIVKQKGLKVIYKFADYICFKGYTASDFTNPKPWIYEEVVDDYSDIMNSLLKLGFTIK